jgi:sulfate permease, SulP family
MTVKASFKKNFASDLIAGVTTGVANIPDAMAAAILAGVNPVYGLYSLMIGTPVGALLGSSQFMQVCATNAMAVATGLALVGRSGDTFTQSLFLLALLVGAIELIAGLLRFGRFMRFVSNSVMRGFLTGISVLVVLSQVADFTGYASKYSNKVVKLIDTLFHLNQIQLPTFLIGLLTVGLILLLNRTRVKNFSMLLGIAIASIVVLLFSLNSIQQVSDIAKIPSGFPLPKLPDLRLLPGLIVPALSIAVIGLVQGAGISKGYKNPDGDYPNVSRDFVGQGAANMAVSLFQGMPVGGSVGSTALNVSSGARSRWASVFSGVVVAIVVLFFARAIGLVAIPAMAALLIVAGIQSINVDEILDVWEVALMPRFVMLATFIATLVLPLQWAVLFGVILSMAVHFIQMANDIKLVEIVETSKGSFREQPSPKVLASRSITVLQVYGTLFYATADKLAGKLPYPQGAERPVVILRLRSQRSVGSTFIQMLVTYATELKESSGKLILTGINPKVLNQLESTDTFEKIPREDIFQVNDELGVSSAAAISAAKKWLAGND